MVTISKINTTILTQKVGNPTRNIAKIVLPAASGLAVLAGSSLGGDEFMHGNPLPSGASVTDPFWDQLTYTGEKALDCFSEIGDAIGDGASNIIDSTIDFIGDALDLFSGGAG